MPTYPHSENAYLTHTNVNPNSNGSINDGNIIECLPKTVKRNHSWLLLLGVGAFLAFTAITAVRNK